MRAAALLAPLAALLAYSGWTLATQGHSATQPPPVLAGISGYLRSNEVLSWASTGAPGYALYRDGQKVSTAGAGATSARFSMGYAGMHTLSVVAVTVTTTTTPRTTITIPTTTTHPVTTIPVTTQPVTTVPTTTSPTTTIHYTGTVYVAPS